MTGTTTVRLSARSKEKLDKLQARLVLTDMGRLSKEELLDRLIDLGTTMPERIARPYPRLSPERMARFLALPVRTGMKTRQEDIDRDLYGEPPA